MGPFHYAIVINYNGNMRITEEQIKEGIDLDLSTLTVSASRRMWLSHNPAPLNNLPAVHHAPCHDS